jgi:hypothetical protein
VISSETYRRYARDLSAFSTALHEFLSVMQQGGSAPDSQSGWVPVWQGGPLNDSPTPWTPQPGREAEAAERKMKVDWLSGKAAYAFAAAGSFIEWKPRGTWQTQPVNPATEWATILDWDPRFDAGTIFACATQALGILEMKAEAVEEYERHKVRRAVRWVGRLTGSGLRPAARWSVRLAAPIATAGIVYFLGWS